MSESAVYRYPRYYAIGYQWNTDAECAFIEACLKAHGSAGARRSLDSHAVGGVAWDRPERAPRLGPASLGASAEPVEARAERVEGRILDIGCGSGRHLTRLAQRGYEVTGVDVRPEMVAFVEAEAKKADLKIRASVDDLRHLALTGTFDLAFCFMDTFRFLLTNEEILGHLRAVAGLLAPGGLYLTDFWIPTRWDQIASEIHQWEQSQGDTTVRVFYLQHPESVDPISQTFEDELVFEVHEGGEIQEIRGGRTRTRLIMPQEFRLLVDASGVLALVGSYGGFDLAKPFDPDSLTWRMVSVLKKWER